MNQATSNTSHRSAVEVFNDHLWQGKHGSVEQDLPRNFAEDVVMLTGRGVYHGYDGMRYLAQLLREELPNARFEYITVQLEGEVGFLEWTAQADGAYVEDGADSFVIRDGRIVAQTIHYTVKRRG
jgi:hypothetical protein